MISPIILWAMILILGLIYSNFVLIRSNSIINALDPSSHLWGRFGWSLTRANEGVLPNIVYFIALKSSSNSYLVLNIY
jgi:hypothetical protein